MSLAENLLNSLDETAYANARIAGGGVEEEHIVVDASRTITVPANLKTIAVKGDKDIETVTIDCIRYWDGHDLSQFAVYINYILPNGDESTYIPENLTVFEDMFSFTWTIGREITSYQGGITFWIVAKLTDESGNLIKQWSSFQNSEFTIAQGGDKIYVPETQTEKDVISQVLAVSTNAAQRAEEAAGIAMTISNSALIDLQQTRYGETNGGINIWSATFASGGKRDLIVKDGSTPFIGTNGNWWIGNTDTGVPASGSSGGGSGGSVKMAYGSYVGNGDSDMSSGYQTTIYLGFTPLFIIVQMKNPQPFTWPNGNVDYEHGGTELIALKGLGRRLSTFVDYTAESDDILHGIEWDSDGVRLWGQDEAVQYNVAGCEYIYFAIGE